MRPLELALVTADVLAFVLLVVPLPGRLPALRHAVPLAGAIAVVQLLVEGHRWQLFPAYAVAGALGVGRLVRVVRVVRARRTPPRPVRRSWRRRVGLGSVVVVGVLALAVSAALPAALPVFRFPPPTGPFGVGTVTYHWVDADREERLSADPSDRRELMAQVWYPTTGVSSSSERAPYVPDAAAVSAGAGRVLGVPPFLFTHFGLVTTNAVPAAPVSDTAPRYPVLVYLTGFAGFRQVSTFQVEELTSQGYVVVGLDQPYASASVVFPDGRQVDALDRDTMNRLVEQSVHPVEPAPVVAGHAFPGGIISYLAEDVPFALDRLTELDRDDPRHLLTGRLDLQHVGLFGVSLGGFTTAEACRADAQPHAQPDAQPDAQSDARIDACLIMEAAMPADVVRDGLDRPSMWITRDAGTMRLERRRSGGWSEKDITDHLTTMRATYDGLTGDGYFLEVPGMFHVNLTDLPSWSPLLGRLGVIGPIDPRRAHHIVTAYSVAFFDRHLKGSPAPLLDGPTGAYPDVRLGTRRSHRPT